MIFVDVGRRSSYGGVAGRSRNRVSEVNRPMGEEALKAVQQSAGHGVPLGTDGWKARIAARLGLEIPLRPRGWPRRQREQSYVWGSEPWAS